MFKRKTILVLTLCIWLANYLLCFCGCEDDFENAVKSEIAYFSENHTDTESEPASENSHYCCHYCCGNQLIFNNPDQTSLAGKPPTYTVKNLSPIFSEQLYLTSIFRPPKA